MQAWGLLELQRGNVLAAVLLLERCVANDPRCSPVLKWKAVRVLCSLHVAGHDIIGIARLNDACLDRVYTSAGPSVGAQASDQP